MRHRVEPSLDLSGRQAVKTHMHCSIHRLRLLLRLLLALLLVILLLMVAAFCFLQSHSQPLIEQYASEAAAQSGLTITIGTAYVEMFPLPALAVSDARVEGKGWSFSVAYATLQPHLPSLLHGVLRPRSITLLRPHIRGILPLSIQDMVAEQTATAPAEEAPANRFTHTAFTALLPENCQLHVSQGDMDITSADGMHLTLNGLRCGLHLVRGTRLKGNLFWDEALFAPRNAVPTRLTSLALKGNTHLDNPLHHTPELELKGRLQRTDWLASLEVALQVSTQGASPRLHMALTGDLRKDTQLIPISLVGTAIRQEDTEAIRLEDIRFALGKDSGAFNGTLRHGIPEVFSLDGRLLLRRASLTQWLGFARSLPPGLQHALDALTDGVLDFSLDSKGLRVPHIEATASGSRFTGSGGVASWAQPVVALDLTAPMVNLGRALPESTGTLPVPPQYGHEAFTPKPGNPVIPGELNVGYDIRLNAAAVAYGPLEIKDAHVVIKPGLVDAKSRLEDTLLLVQGKLYGGNVKGETILGGSEETPYAIRVQLNNIDGGPLARALPILPVTGGRLQGDVNIMSQGKELNMFLNRLRGNVNVHAERGKLRSSRKNSAFAFRTLDVSFKARSGQWKQNRLGLDGQWDATLADTGLNAQAKLSGTLWFGGAGGQVAFQNLPGEFTCDIAPERSLKLSGLQAQASGRCSFQANSAVFSLTEGLVRALGAEAKGNIYLNMGTNEPAWQGKLVLSIPDMLKTLRLAGVSPSRLPRDLNKLFLEANFKGNANELALNNLRTRVSATDIKGSFTANWRNALAFQFNLTTPHLNLDHYFPPQGSKSKGHNATHSPPWDFRFMQTFNAKGELRAEQISLWKLHIHDAYVAVKLEHGLLDVQSGKARFYGAPVSAHAKVLCDRGLNVSSSFAAEGFDLGEASRDRGGEAALGGKASFAATLKAVLTESGQLASKLDGSWRFTVNQGFHQPRDKHGALKGKPTRFAMAGASGSLNAGLARSNNFQLKGDDLIVTGGGWVNLANETLDCNFLVNKKNFPDFPLRLYGQFDNTKTSIGAGTLLLNTLGGIAGGVVDLLGSLLEGTWKIFR